jgi:hypothetical protein
VTRIVTRPTAIGALWFLALQLPSRLARQWRPITIPIARLGKPSLCPCILPLPAVTKPQRLSVDGSAQPSGAIEPVQAWCPVHRFHQEPVATQERFLLWSERHGDALRQRAANEIDWDNVAEEIEDMGNNVVRSVASHLVQAILHDVPTARLAVLRLLRAPSTCRLTKSKTPPLGAVVLGPGASSGAAWTRLCNGTPAFCLRVPA